MVEKKFLLVLAIVVVALSVIPMALAENSSGQINISINDNLTVSVSNTPMVFALDVGIADENGITNTPFNLENTGSVVVDIAMCATEILWMADNNDINSYQWIADFNEAGACGTGNGVMPNDSNWNDMNIIGQGDAAFVCDGLKIGNSEDEINVGIRIQSPSSEPTISAPSSTITFYVAADTGIGNDAAQGTCT